MIAIRNAKVFPVSGDPIERGEILIQDGRFVAVGKDLPVPGDARVIDAEGLCAVPGLIDAHTHVGVTGEILGPRFQDNNENLQPLQPHLRILDGIWHEDPAFSEILRAGVTSVWICPGSVNVFGGVGVAVKTRPGPLDGRVIDGTGGMKMAFGENVTRVHYGGERYPGTRMGVAALARRALFDARRYGDDLAKGRDRKPDFMLEALLPLLEKRMKARVHAHRSDDILTAVRIGGEFGLDLVIEHGTEGYRVREVLADRGVPVVAGPHLGGRSKPEVARRKLANVARLHEKGIRVAIMTDGASAVRFLPIHAAIAVREGLPFEAALKAITLDAARIIGAGERLGSIEPGKDADLVLLPGGNPLDVMVKPKRVFVDGECLYKESREDEG